MDSKIYTSQSPDYNRTRTANGKDFIERFSPFSENKNKEWYMYWANMYISAFSSTQSRYEDEAYKKYRGIRQASDFEYITKSFGAAMPVPDIPHVPLISRFINHLRSTNDLRPLVFNIKYNDVDAVQAKDKEMTERVAKQLMGEIMQSVDKQMQEGGEIKQEENNQALQEKTKEILKQIPDFRTVQEKAAQKTMDLAIERLNLRDKWSTAFLDKLVTGKQYYRCKLNRKGELPQFDIINTGDIAFSADNVDSLNESTFVVHRHWLGVQEVYAKYGHLLNAEEKSRLNRYAYTYTSDSRDKRQQPSEFSEINSNDFGYTGSQSSNGGIEIHEVEWKAVKKIAVTELNGKYEILREDSILTDKEEVKYKYFQELHTCVRLDGNIYLKYGTVEYARRDPNNISKCLLSFNGRLYNNRNNPPLSMVRELGDLQDRYDILWYKLLEMILLSGNKGITMIKELIPNGDLDDWMYWRKLGVMQLSIAGEGVHKELINQIGQVIQPYDDSLSQNGIQSIIALLNQIEKTVGDICGVPPQALGQTQQYETKANVETSITQGTITTEVIHRDHSNFVRDSLNDILYWSKIGLSEGTLKDYVLSPAEQALTKDLSWNYIDYNVFVTDSFREEKNLMTAKKLVQELAMAQAISFGDVIKSLNSNSMNEINNIVNSAVKEMREAQQKNAQGEQQAKQQELQAKMQLEQAKMQQDAQLEQAKMQQEKEKHVTDNSVKKEETSIKERLAVVEERYAEIAQKQLDADISTSNAKISARKGKNE